MAACTRISSSRPHGDNRRLINIAMDDLGFETQAFAHRRMDQSIKKVLSGRKVDEIKVGEEGEQA